MGLSFSGHLCPEKKNQNKKAQLRVMFSLVLETQRHLCASFGRSGDDHGGVSDLVGKKAASQGKRLIGWTQSTFYSYDPQTPSPGDRSRLWVCTQSHKWTSLIDRFVLDIIS